MPVNGLIADLWNSGERGWRCDFCMYGDAPQLWAYPNDAFVVRVPPASAVRVPCGVWTACEACHLLVDKDEYAALTDFALEHLLENIGQGTDIEQYQRYLDRSFLLRLFNLFRAHRIGDPVQQPRLVKDGKFYHESAT